MASTTSSSPILPLATSAAVDQTPPVPTSSSNVASVEKVPDVVPPAPPPATAAVLQPYIPKRHSKSDNGRQGPTLRKAALGVAAVHKKTLVGMSNGDVRRLARRGGVKRVPPGACDEARVSLRLFLADIEKAAVEYACYARRNTVRVSDVTHALELNGIKLYGHDEKGHSHRHPQRAHSSLATVIGDAAAAAAEPPASL